jgi:choline transporter-like protein 2/4/5
MQIKYTKNDILLCDQSCRLTYELDYKGNVCGDRHGDPDVHELDVRYWMNPNQVYQSGIKGSKVNLADAKAICLMECPTPTSDGVNFVCDYPDGDIKISIDEWINRDYDYFEFLTPDMRNSSLQLQGPCYPVIFPSVNGEPVIFHSEPFHDTFLYAWSNRTVRVSQLVQ